MAPRRAVLDRHGRCSEPVWPPAWGHGRNEVPYEAPVHFESVLRIAPGDGSCRTCAIGRPAVASPFTTANVLVGVSSPSSGREPVVGGALGWDVARRLNIEMTAKWVLPDRGAETMSLTFGANVRLAPDRAVVPFLSAGVGLYKASFDRSWSDLPGFYGRRLSEPGMRLQETIEFTDPALAVGGGVSVFASRHVSIRPEVEVLWLRAGCELNHVLTSASVRLAYHLEQHPVTPAVSTRAPRSR